MCARNWNTAQRISAGFCRFLSFPLATCSRFRWIRWRKWVCQGTCLRRQLQVTRRNSSPVRFFDVIDFASWLVDASVLSERGRLYSAASKSESARMKLRASKVNTLPNSYSAIPCVDPYLDWPLESKQLPPYQPRFAAILDRVTSELTLSSTYATLLDRINNKLTLWGFDRNVLLHCHTNTFSPCVSFAMTRLEVRKGFETHVSRLGKKELVLSFVHIEHESWHLFIVLTSYLLVALCRLVWKAAFHHLS